MVRGVAIREVGAPRSARKVRDQGTAAGGVPRRRARLRRGRHLERSGVSGIAAAVRNEADAGGGRSSVSAAENHGTDRTAVGAELAPPVRNSSARQRRAL